MGLDTVLKPCLKGENTNITKTILKFKKIHLFKISFKILKSCSDENIL